MEGDRVAGDAVDGDELYERGVAAADAGDRAAAVACWFRALDGGSADADRRLTAIADRGGAPDEVAAWDEALLAADDATSLRRLGTLSAARRDRDGLGAWLELAARHDDPDALCELGLWRHANHRADGREYLARAARLGHGYAGYRLGLSLLQRGRRRSARRWWVLAAGHGRAEATDALEVLGTLRRPRGGTGEEPAWWTAALREADPDALYVLARAPRPTDRDAGVPTWRRAAALRDRVVYWCLGSLAVRRGRLGEGWLWLAASARRGDAKAMYGLGLLAVECSERDVAIGWFGRADRAGHPDAAAARRQLLTQRDRDRR